MSEPITGERGHVFVCYSHADAGWVYPEIQWLTAQGVHVWFDDGIRPGEEWTGEIANAIQAATHLLFFATERAVGSRHCRNEVHHGVQYGKPVIAVFLEPAQLPPGLELELSLQQAIVAHGADPERYRARLLAALGTDAARHPLFTAPAKHAASQFADGSSRAAGTVTAPPANAIAVLPLYNLSNDPEDEYFSEGVSEEILDRLCRIASLKVIARGSSFRFRERNVDIRDIGRQLNARFIVEGTLRRADRRVRISARLSDASDGLQLWSARFDGQLEDIFGLQEDMAERVLAGLRESGSLPLGGELSASQAASPSRQPTQKSGAHDALLRGLRLHRQQDFAGAAHFFERAVSLDSNYGEAYARLAETCLDVFAALQGQLTAQAEYLPRALAAAGRAWQIDPNSELANRVMSKTRLFSYEWASAQRYSLRALRGNRNSAENYIQHAQLLRSTTRSEQSLEYVRWAESLDPLRNARAFVAWVLIDMRRFAEARAICLQEIARHPDVPNLHYIQLAATFGGEGDFEQVVHWQSHRHFPLRAIAFTGDYPQRLLDGLHTGGRRGYFQVYLDWVLEMKRAGGTFVLDTFLVWAYGELGYLDEAFIVLDQVSKGSFIPQQYFYDALRRDRRWDALLASHGLDAASIHALDAQADQYKLELQFVEPWRDAVVVGTGEGR